MSKKKIPNCKLCDWNSTGSLNGEEYKECGAQGYKLSCDVYNKRQCRKLYSTRIINKVVKK